MANYCRTTYMTTNLRGIIRSLGLPETPETWQRIYKMRMQGRKAEPQP